MPFRARVLISCGQRTTEERAAAESIAALLTQHGYQPYVATEQSNLKGLKEGIFPQLSDAEYFLFVDFLRKGPRGDLTPSLFTHEELAIASFLELDFMGFRQRGTALDGVLSFLQGNCAEFGESSDLPSLVDSRLKEANWSPNWQKGLHLAREEGEYIDANIGGDQSFAARFFHLRVTNTHRFKPAVGCRAYINRLYETQKGEVKQGRAVELKWAGYQFPDVIIPPGGARELDIGYVLHRHTSAMAFTSFSDSDEYNAALLGPGSFGVDFIVLSENFPPVGATVLVTLERKLEEVDVRFSRMLAMQS